MDNREYLERVCKEPLTPWKNNHDWTGHGDDFIAWAIGPVHRSTDRWSACERAQADGAFIAAARAEVPKMLAGIDALNAEIDGWKSKYIASVNERHEIMQELEALRGEARWIPVEESLPDTYASVLIYHGEFPSQGYYSGELWREYDPLEENGIEEVTVTHWKPMPPSPVQE